MKLLSWVHYDWISGASWKVSVTSNKGWTRATEEPNCSVSSEVAGDSETRMMYHDKQLENIVNIQPTSRRSFSQWQGDNITHIDYFCRLTFCWHPALEEIVVDDLCRSRWSKSACSLCETKISWVFWKISLYHEVAIDYQHDYVTLIYAESTGRKESYLARDRSFSRRGAAVT